MKNKNDVKAALNKQQSLNIISTSIKSSDVNIRSLEIFFEHSKLKASFAMSLPPAYQADYDPNSATCPDPETPAPPMTAQV
jgi:hypothetical protein